MVKWFVVCLVLILPACAQRGGRPKPPPAVLESMVGKDLMRQPDNVQAALAAALGKAIGQKVRLESSGLRPWRVVRFGRDRVSYLVVEVYEGAERASTSGVRLHRFDAGWRHLGSSEFPTGHRTRVREVLVDRENPLAMPLLVVRTLSTGPFAPGTNQPLHDVAGEQEQYYAIGLDWLRLVRVGLRDGPALRSVYATKVPFKGPRLPERTADEWATALESKDLTVVLQALMWLAGAHLAVDAERKAGANLQSAEDSRKFAYVRGMERVQKRVGVLRRSENAWVREVAEMVK